MEKKLKIAFGMVSMSLIAIVAFQFYWTVSAFHVNKKAFENRIDIAMQQALDSCKKHYFDSIRVMLVKRLSDTGQIKIKMDTTFRFKDDKVTSYSYNINLCTPTGERLGFLIPKRPTFPLGLFNGSGSMASTNKSKPTGIPKGIVVGNGGKTATVQNGKTNINAALSRMFNRAPAVQTKTTPAVIQPKPTTAADADPYEPTLTMDNKRWDFYKRMIKHPATAPEVITEMSFYVPNVMESLWWALMGVDERMQVNRDYMKEVMAKYKGAARDTFLAHGGSFQKVGLMALSPDYIKIERDRLQKYLTVTLSNQHINTAFNLNLATKHAVIDTAQHFSATTEQEYQYYGMRIFHLSASKPALYAQAVFTNSKYAVLKEMAFTLIASLLLIILTAAAFVYTIRIIFHQKKLADLKDDFINNMTHELKTPIATITVAVEALQKFNALNDPEKTQRYLQTSRVELNRLNDLVTKVLNIATFENKDVDMVLTQIDLDELIHDVIQTEKAKAIKPVEISYLNEGVKFIFADKLHFRNMINNLVDNAVKYSGTEAHISITCRQDAQHVYISVKDEGIGIAPADLAQIFDKFYRVPTGNLHNVKGTGLGLSYVKYIAEAHGGRVDVKSDLGAGTEFTVSLPLING